jgi:hypothetical protein
MDINAINVLIEMSGSIMSPTNVLKQYRQLTDPKRKYLYSKIKPIIKKYENTWNDKTPLLVIDLGICSADNNIDPAVALMIGIKKGKII